MDISESTQRYFKEIAERTQDYFDTLEFTKEYIAMHGISDHDGILDCVLLSILWCASKRQDSLTEEDVCVFLNVDETVEKGEISVEIAPEMREWSLEEILEYVKGSCGTF